MRDPLSRGDCRPLPPCGYELRRTGKHVSRAVVQKPSIGDSGVAPSTWLVLTNHGNVLLCVARGPTIRISEIARRVGIGERAAQKIVADLVAEGFLARIKEGRRNRYEV